MRRRRLVFLLSSFLLSPSVQAQTVQGYLLDADTDAPVMLGEVQLLTGSGVLASQSYTDENGFFSISAEEPGEYFLRAWRMGYTPRIDGMFELGVGGIISVEFRLLRAPVVLDMLSVSAEGETPLLRSMGFFQRREDEEGIFLGPEELAEISAFQTSHFFRNLPRVRVSEDQIGDTRISMAGAGRVSLVQGRSMCYPKVLIDGTVVFRGGDEPSLVDRVVQPHEVVGIEIYRGASEIPARFGGSSSPCGVILIWTG